MESIITRRKGPNMANMDIKKAIRKDPKPLVTTKRPTKTIITKSTNSTIAKRRKVITKNTAASTNSMNRKKANTRKVIIINPATKKDTKVNNKRIYVIASHAALHRNIKTNISNIYTIFFKFFFRCLQAKRDIIRKDITIRPTKSTMVNMVTTSIILITIIMQRKVAKRDKTNLVTAKKDIKCNNSPYQHYWPVIVIVYFVLVDKNGL